MEKAGFEARSLRSLLVDYLSSTNIRTMTPVIKRFQRHRNRDGQTKVRRTGHVTPRSVPEDQGCTREDCDDAEEYVWVRRAKRFLHVEMRRSSED
uniref:Uncharacterized protein n=1 Tax=Magallana gigas TaxID=29159 RepID=A0A8W8IXN9_MAGGI